MDVAEHIVHMAEGSETKKEFIVAQMVFGDLVGIKGLLPIEAVAPYHSSACLVNHHTGSGPRDSGGLRRTSLEHLLSIGWKIERQFAVSKIVNKDHPYFHRQDQKADDMVSFEVQHFFLSKTRE